MAEISPEHAARIESLRAQHAENPARFFVPLASAYREAGEGAKAEELLRENLKRHPGYVSAHVLLGRCLADRGAVAEARNEFRYVLSVDSQNLIALRSLGEMAAAGSDYAEARRWYGELLAVDPMNADARDALSALDTAEAAPPTPAEPAAPSATPSEAEAGYGMVDIAAAPEAEGDEGAAALDVSWGEVSLDATPAGSATEEAAAAPADFNAFEFGAVDLDAQPAADEPDLPAPSPADAWGSVDDDVQGAAGAEPLPSLELGGFYEGEAAGGYDHAHDDGEEVVTETMAELYARQGFVDRAADMYRELITRRGEEPALVRRLEELERQLRAGAEAQSAAPEASGEGETTEAADWLERVDFSISGAGAADDASAAGGDALAPLDLDLPGVETSPEVAGSELQGLIPAHDVLPPDEYAGEETDEGGSEDAWTDAAGSGEAAGVAATGDSFADSFAHGFAGGDAPEAETGAASFAATLAEPEPAETGDFGAAPEEAA
ncbi:MAG TPA: tetratricopeptide repeat protein, partial [Longimicrobium sp.]|nr:tetratricopeptide repeat protein [Longimicrobium sp.]